jgi:glycolate oxidase FAD binding subunit
MCATANLHIQNFHGFEMVKPRSDVELAEIIRNTTTPFEIIGTGTKRGLGRSISEIQPLSLSQFSDVLAYEPEELILDVGASAKLSEIEKLLDTKRQYLAFEPPDLSKLLGSKHSGTMGGMLACNLSGPRRIKAGAARDHVLGLNAVSGRGEIFKAGARVVKNVTGYDVPKLMAGSYGTLAAFTSVIFKVLPKPETEVTLLIAGLDDAAAVRCMSAALQSSCEVSGAAHIPEVGTALRLEGIAASVSYRREKLGKLLGGKIEILNADESVKYWRRVRDVLPLADNLERHVWRLSVTPSEAPKIAQKLKSQIDLRCYFDWAGGLIWLDTPQEAAQIIRAAIGDGHATLIRAPDTVRSVVEVFQPQPEALAALSARVKNSFDPRGVFNPSRMYKGV